MLNHATEVSFTSLGCSSIHSARNLLQRCVLKEDCTFRGVSSESLFRKPLPARPKLWTNFSQSVPSMPCKLASLLAWLLDSLSTDFRFGCRDYGYVGCGVSVLPYVDTRCSGRRACTINIPDPVLDKVQPCPGDLKSYLQASFSCVRGELQRRLNCDASKVRTIFCTYFNNRRQSFRQKRVGQPCALPGPS